MKTGFKWVFGWLMCTVFLLPGVAMGEETQSTADLAERVAQLEKKLNETIPAALGNWDWLDRISFSGTVEVEASWERSKPKGGDKEDSSDLQVATAELDIDADVMKYASGHLALLWEEDEEDGIVVDEGYIRLHGADVLPLYLQVGRMYVPFGNFTTNMISDPLTLEIGETQETAAQVGFEAAGFYGSVFVFNGDADSEEGEDHVEDFGAQLGYKMEKENFSFDMGVSFISNMMDSDNLTDAWNDAQDEAEEAGYSIALHDDLPGFGAYAVVGIGPVTLIGEYLTSLEDPEYRLADGTSTLASLGLSEKAEGDKISAWNVELGYTFEVFEKETVWSVTWQGTENTDNLYPENRYGTAVGVALFEHVNVALEYLHDEYENDDKAEIVTMQLALEF